MCMYDSMYLLYDSCMLLLLSTTVLNDMYVCTYVFMYVYIHCYTHKFMAGIVKENYGFPKTRPEKTTLKQYYHQKLSINVLIQTFKG